MQSVLSKPRSEFPVRVSRGNNPHDARKSDLPMHRPKLQKPLHNSNPAGRSQSSNHVSFANLSPQTPAEHYWASRALKAEALLSAREKHFEEVGKVREEEEIKRRSLEIRYKEKYNNLERLVTPLVLAMISLVVLLTYVVASHNNANLFNSANTPSFPFLSFLWGPSSSSHLSKKGSDPSRFNFHLHLPSHFTIPILSPWASVVENQTSSTISTSTSSGFYSLLLISFLCIGISSVIIWKYQCSRRGDSDKKLLDSQRSLFPCNLSQLWGSTLNPALSSLVIWQWVWSWTYRLLRLIGFAPR